MTAGLGVLRLPPAIFWSMTLRELDAALRGAFDLPCAGASPSRADLAALMKSFPDREDG